MNIDPPLLPMSPGYSGVYEKSVTFAGMSGGRGCRVDNIGGRGYVIRNVEKERMTGKYMAVNKFRWVIVIAFLFVCGSAAGQFTIPNERKAPKKIPGVGDSLRTVEIAPEKFYSAARVKAERQERRKERNYFQFDTRLDISQTQFENWTAGSDNTFMAKVTVDLQHKYTRKKLTIESKFNARYGMNYIEKKMFKNEDYFKINHAVSWKIHNNWSYSATSELTSQFSVGRISRDNKGKRSNFMAPGNWKPAVGFAYSKAPWSITISPIGGSTKFMLDDDLLPKDKEGNPNLKERATWQVGSSLRVEFKRNFLKDVIELKSEFYGFTNYNKAPTARWETTCKIKATKFLATTLYSKMLYDETSNVTHKRRVQYNYSIGVGLTYTFKNK